MVVNTQLQVDPAARQILEALFTEAIKAASEKIEVQVSQSPDSLVKTVIFRVKMKGE